MIHTGEMMIDMLSGDYSSPACKLSRMVGDGEVIRLKRGVYETDFRTPPYLVAQDICGPSYISFEYALAWYGIIPERVVAVTSATNGKRRKKSFDTPLGLFTYADVPSSAFYEQVATLDQDGREFAIATPEKAVCDKLYQLPPTRTFGALETLMYDDMRFDEDWIQDLNRGEIAKLADLYRCTTIRTFASYLEAT